MKTDRQLLVEATAKKLNIPDGLMRGIVVPEGTNVEEFLIDYKNSIPVDMRTHISTDLVQGTAAEHEYAQNLLNEFGVDKTA